MSDFSLAEEIPHRQTTIPLQFFNSGVVNGYTKEKYVAVTLNHESSVPLSLTSLKYAVIESKTPGQSWLGDLRDLGNGDEG